MTYENAERCESVGRRVMDAYMILGNYDSNLGSPWRWRVITLAALGEADVKTLADYTGHTTSTVRDTYRWLAEHKIGVKAVGKGKFEAMTFEEWKKTRR